MKDVVACDKPRGVGKQTLIRGFPNGETRPDNWTLLTERSEEHTSELQSRVDLVCRLLLEKKKKKQKRNINHIDKHIRRKNSTEAATKYIRNERTTTNTYADNNIDPHARSDLLRRYPDTAP